MHELSVVAGLFEHLQEQIKPYEPCQVTLIKLRIGTLSGLVPELLESSFEACKKGTFAERARLEIEIVKPCVRCQNCGGETFKEELDYTCTICNSRDVVLIAGDELIMEKVIIETDD